MNHDLVSRAYRPDSEKCCESCVFGKGEHANFCAKRNQPLASPQCRCAQCGLTNGSHTWWCAELKKAA
jgi:hypothetical protein